MDSLENVALPLILGRHHLVKQTIQGSALDSLSHTYLLGDLIQSMALNTISMQMISKFISPV